MKCYLCDFNSIGDGEIESIKNLRGHYTTYNLVDENNYSFNQLFTPGNY